ncbi:MAG: cytochrome b/b6 domain-containing protein [Gammaproteobacteria bacterium]
MKESRLGPGFSPALRRLHFAVAILVTVQIIIGLTMSPRHTPTLFLTHQLLGLTIAALVLLHWLRLFARERDQLGQLIPVSGPVLRVVADDLRGLLHGRMPQADPRPGLPALIHGLGLLALTAVAALGTGIYVLIRIHHIRSGLGHTLHDLHVFFVWVLIVYWCGHVLLAIAHEARGDHVIARMFRLGR